ncbi:putative reverse transcriptase domain-containing protein [Tanacetum coccineum]
MHGCSYKTFTNGKPHSFNGTEGVVGLKCWFEKMEQVFEICKCAEVMEHSEVSYVHVPRSCSDLWNGNGIQRKWLTSSKPATLHDAINMARELIEQGVQASNLKLRVEVRWNYHGANRVHRTHHQPGRVLLGGNSYNVTCFGCGNHGHYRSDCPELKNQN